MSRHLKLAFFTLWKWSFFLVNVFWVVMQWFKTCPCQIVSQTTLDKIYWDKGKMLFLEIFWRHSWFWKAYNGLKLGQLLFSIFLTPPPICPKYFVHDCLRFAVFWNLNVYAIRLVQLISNGLFCRKCALCSLSWCSRCSKVYLSKPLFRFGPNEISVNKPVAKMVPNLHCGHVDQPFNEKLA